MLGNEIVAGNHANVTWARFCHQNRVSRPYGSRQGRQGLSPKPYSLKTEICGGKLEPGRNSVRGIRCAASTAAGRGSNRARLRRGEVLLPNRRQRHRAAEVDALTAAPSPALQAEHTPLLLLLPLQTPQVLPLRQMPRVHADDGRAAPAVAPCYTTAIFYSQHVPNAVGSCARQVCCSSCQPLQHYGMLPLGNNYNRALDTHVSDAVCYGNHESIRSGS